MVVELVKHPKPEISSREGEGQPMIFLVFMTLCEAFEIGVVVRW